MNRDTVINLAQAHNHVIIKIKVIIYKNHKNLIQNNQAKIKIIVYLVKN